MTEFLSAEWFEQANKLLATSHFNSSDLSEPFVIQYCLTDAPLGKDISYYLDVSANKVTLMKDIDNKDRVSLTITQDYSCANSLSEGTMTIQEALSAGRIKIKGKVDILTGEHKILERIHQALTV
ncbi:MAG: SCP2 sterol-binding domain-containing protein [Actinobacteria bacterium]|nr:SCP2 sterol-binding domain-containing protein [Actinomycetota bacterium]